MIKRWRCARASCAISAQVVWHELRSQAKRRIAPARSRDCVRLQNAAPRSTFCPMVAGEAAGSAEVLPKPVVDKLVREYQVCARDNPKMAVATVAIKTLTTLISQSQATTMMGLEKEIKEAAGALQRCEPHTRRHTRGYAACACGHCEQKVMLLSCRRHQAPLAS